MRVGVERSAHYLLKSEHAAFRTVTAMSSVTTSITATDSIVRVTTRPQKGKYVRMRSSVSAKLLQVFDSPRIH
jgi:hypothetical protein